MKYRSALRNDTIVAPEPIERQTGPGMAHNIDCNSRWAIMKYDDRCLRCMKMKHVIMLRRKNRHNGASIPEYLAAQEISKKIILEYDLTVGEVYDPEYPEAPIPQRERRRGKAII